MTLGEGGDMTFSKKKLATDIKGSTDPWLGTSALKCTF